MSDKLYQREQPAASSGKQLPIKQETTKGSASDSEGVGERGVGRERGVGVWEAAGKASSSPQTSPRLLERNCEAVSLSEITRGDTFLIC